MFRYNIFIHIKWFKWIWYINNINDLICDCFLDTNPSLALLRGMWLGWEIAPKARHLDQPWQESWCTVNRLVNLWWFHQHQFGIWRGNNIQYIPVSTRMVALTPFLVFHMVVIIGILRGCHVRSPEHHLKYDDCCSYPESSSAWSAWWSIAIFWDTVNGTFTNHYVCVTKTDLVGGLKYVLPIPTNRTMILNWLLFCLALG